MALIFGDQNGSRFQHERLSSQRNIRLIKLLGSADFDSPIKVEVIETGLDIPASEQPAYEALSYVWGSRSGTEEVSCNGQMLFVTPNCRSALRYLRITDQSRVLWVDSICIDQNDTAEAVIERNAQVAAMGEIYAKATRTLCWLGGGTAYTDNVIRRLEQIGSCPSQRGFVKLMDLERRLRMKGVLDEEVSCLDHIFCHPWHSRIWTVQEVAFSSSCQVVCGSSSMPWDCYYTAAKFLIFEQFIDALDFQASRNMVGIDMRNVIRAYVLARKLNDSSIDEGVHEEDLHDEQDRQVTFLTSCLTDVNQLRATDPKDKIYGLHALYTNLGIPMPPVDYTKPIASVYTDAAIAMVTWSRSLSILCDACSIDREPTLPSWVPDWNDDGARMSMPSLDATRGSRLDDATIERLSQHTGRLIVRGVIIGSVIGEPDAGAMLPFPTRSTSCELAILSTDEYRVVDDVEFLRLLIDKIRFFRELLYTIEVHSTLFGEYSVEDIFHDLLTLGERSFRADLFEKLLDTLRYPNSRCKQSAGQALVAKWLAADAANSDHWTAELINCATIVASLVSGDPITAKNEPLPSQAEMTELVKELSENLGDQTVITVQLDQSLSRTIGTTFRAVNSGDSVVLLEGADWPVVVRQSCNDWSFIGPAYVIGFENGEAWPEVDSSQNEEMREFILI